MIDPNFPDVFGAMAGFGIVLAIVWFVTTLALILLAIWIHYTIMWKAVRRGMREFHYGGNDAPRQVSGYTAPPTQ